MKTRFAIAALAMSAGLAAAQVVVLDIGGVANYDGLGDASNTHMQTNIGAGSEVVSISWDVTIETVSPSWLCEVQVDFTTNGGAGAYSLLYTDLDCFDGVGSYAGSAPVSVTVGGDGILDLEFWENFVDYADDVDSVYLQGAITIEYVPAPSAMALLGLGGLAAIRRRR